MRARTLFFVLLPFLIGGVCQGVNDAVFSNNSIYSLFLGLTIMSYILGFPQDFVGTLVCTSGYFNPIWGTVTAITFLCGIFLCILYASFYGYHNLDFSQIIYQKRVVAVFVVMAICVFSATWDMVFAIILFKIWTPELLGVAVDWLPPVWTGFTWQITFTWEFGIWFIWFRYVTALLGGYYLLSRYPENYEGV